MKSIRKIAGKVTALTVALLTSAALLNPYYLKANYGEDYYVDIYDSESDPQDGGTGGCKYQVCYVRSKDLVSETRAVSSSSNSTRSGGGQISVDVPKRSGSVSGNGSGSNTGNSTTIITQVWAYTCNKPGGCLTQCTSIVGSSSNAYNCSAKTN
ncbi:MAG: hypothetical protein IPO07_19815 [Haliscomenobacter sp.]|nr:hypothetical protein [Haliscomenobacter sp.]MBK9490778.1 hypothetical protein [Haliscomenobacter sp.]